MKKSEFKALYSHFRKENFDFEQYMQRRNFPCGHDDMLYENFEWACTEWLEQNPVIKQVIENSLMHDELAYRQEKAVFGYNYSYFAPTPQLLKEA